MDETAFWAWAAKLGAGAVILLYGASKILPQVFTARSDVNETLARTGLLDQLQNRLANVEKQVNDAQASLDTERTARRAAEDKVTRLTLRVFTLESMIKSLGGTLPPPIDA